MSPIERDEVVIRNPAELTIAIDALSLSPDTEESRDFLKKFKDIKDDLDAATPGFEDILSLNFKGGEIAERVHADLLTSLEAVTQSDATPEQKLAAQALLETMKA